MDGTKRLRALVTNDDGIDSGFLHALVKALMESFEVTVAAPAREQSWVGRAVSRRAEVTVENLKAFPLPCTAWKIDGTPTDCVNIALGNLMPEKPEIVISGINLGYNTTETLILSSGTVAGAIEGALWGLPAVAFSKVIPNENFEDLRRSNGHATGSYAESLKEAAAHAHRIALETAQRPTTGGVINVNFPAETRAESRIEDTKPARIFLGSLYREIAPGRYAFSYSDGYPLDEDLNSDRACLARGAISRSHLDFSRIGIPATEPLIR